MVSLVLGDIGKPSVLRPSTQVLHKLGTWTDTVSFSNHKDLGEHFVYSCRKGFVRPAIYQTLYEVINVPSALDSARDQFTMNTQEDFEFTRDRT